MRDGRFGGGLVRGAAALLLLAGLSCATVPITGRSQLHLIPDSEMMSMSYSEYDQVLKSSKLSGDATQTDLVRRVGRRVQGAVERYFADRGMADKLRGYRWEFNLVEGKDVNAWCMPGGKVVFYSGILPICRDESGVAVVMGHEVAHAVAGHGGERMSQQLVAQMGGAALAVALREKPEQTRSLWMGAFGAGAQLGVLLPFSRTQESEADHLGLVFLALAGYDPNRALEFWQRMADANRGSAPPEFLSTHPSDRTRIAKIRAELPEAMRYYRPAGSK
ncbi:MAG TPA: M48 family metallopeptidase [Candidatus Eisenbacteria bacterium]|jgi:predicted Zn-dependent protease